MLTMKDGLYIVEIPEHHVYQDVDPGNGKPFPSEVAAQAWQDAFLASAAAAQTATASAETAKAGKVWFLEIVPSATTVAAGSPVTLDISVKDRQGNLRAAVNKTVLIPLVDNTGAIKAILRTTFAGGSASLPWTPGRSGLYRFDVARFFAWLGLDVTVALAAPVEIKVYEA